MARNVAKERLGKLDSGLRCVQRTVDFLTEGEKPDGPQQTQRPENGPSRAPQALKEGVLLPWSPADFGELLLPHRLGVTQRNSGPQGGESNLGGPGNAPCCRLSLRGPQGVGRR